MTISTEERLQLVKNALGNQSDYQNNTLQFYIDEAIDFLIDSGVNENIAKSKKAVGAIVLYINDTWNYSSGVVVYSDALIKRIIQLASKKDEGVDQ
jgi:hypothetical protein